MELDATFLKCPDRLPLVLAVRKENYLYERKMLG